MPYLSPSKLPVTPSLSSSSYICSHLLSDADFSELSDELLLSSRLEWRRTTMQAHHAKLQARPH